MSLLDSEFRADRLNVHNLKLNGIDISNFQIETLGDGKYIDSLRGDIQVQITPSMLDASGNYVIQQIPGLGRFAKVEISSTPRPVYYLAPNGLDTNLGTKTSPWQTLTNVPNGSIVVLLNGTYSTTRSIQLLTYSWNVQSCFYSSVSKGGLTIIGESKSGVIISVNPATNRLVIPSGANVLNGVNLLNFTVQFNGLTSSSSPYFISEERYVSNVCNVNLEFYNCTTQVGYNYYGSDYNRRYNLNITSNNTYSTYTTNIIDTRYNYLYSINSILSNLTINGSSIFTSLDKNTDNIQFSKMIYIKSNTLTFNTDILNFDTITLDIWLEQ